MSCNKREKSNSITHLVKIVCKEVIEEMRHAVVTDVLCQVKNYMVERIRECVRHEVEDQRCGGVTVQSVSDEVIRQLRCEVDQNKREACCSPKHQGDMWSGFSLEILELDLRNAVCDIAKKHGRTPHAIVCQIQNNKLIAKCS